MTQPPKRLLETEKGSLGESLASAKGQLPSSAQLTQLAERLARAGIVVPPEAPSPPPPTPPAAKSLGVGAKAGLGLASIGTAVLVFALTRSHDPPPDAPRTPSSAHVEGSSARPVEPSAPALTRSPRAAPPVRGQPSQPSQPSHAEPAPAATLASPEPLLPPSAEPRVPAAPRLPSGAPLHPPMKSSAPLLPDEVPQQSSAASNRAEPERDATPSGEVELLKRARNSVASDPARALTLARRHAAEFPNGAFAQERDFIVISALVRLGRTSEANALGSSFRDRYRRSAYLPQLDRLLGMER